MIHKKRTFLSLVLFILAYLIFACTAKPETMVNTATPEYAVTLTSLEPTVTATPSPTETPFPTETPDITAIVSQGGPICENAFSQPEEGGTINTPFSALIKTDSVSTWQNIPLNIPFEAKVSQDVQTLICIKEISVKEGYYTNSAVAYRRNWDVSILTWPDGTLIYKETFEGGPPPFAIPANSKDGYGAVPYTDLTNLLSKVSHGGSLFFGGRATIGQISPDKRFGASQDNGDGSIKLWDAKIGKIIYTMGIPKSEAVRQLVFSPDSKLLASVNWNDVAQVWNVETGKLFFTPKVTNVILFAFAPDNETFATLKAEANKTYSVMIWSNKTGKLLHTLKDTYFHFYIQYSPDSKAIVGIAGDNFINFWDIQTQKMVKTIRNSDSIPFQKFSFSPNGKFLVSVSSSQVIMLWNVETGFVIAKFGDSKYSNPEGVHYMDASFTPDGKNLILYSFPDGSEKIIDLNSLP